MRTWWTRKSGKRKEVDPKHQKKSSDDAVPLSSPSGFSGFDSDGGEKKTCDPLPQRSNDNCYLSVSSVSSSGSTSDDRQQLGNADHALLSPSRGPARISSGARSRSPGPGSRGPTSPTSPVHHRFIGMNLGSLTVRQDDSASESHPLPLPPSPVSPSALASARTLVPESPTRAVSKWRRGKPLGRGTFGQVYLGFNSETGKMCAIKEVRVASDDRSFKESLKQLNQEINLLSQLSHPNIVRYYGSELEDETLSVYLEYISGGSIHKLLHDYGAFNEPVIQSYTKQILSGLAYLHERHVVHRDVKGANILVGPSGEVKLADFGMAKHITSCTSMLSFKGSPYWMAPEVVINTNGYSLPVDIWSLGCTILEMATSKPPWSQYEGVAAIFKIGNSKDMPEIPSHLSENAKSFIKLCLQRDPTRRPSASELLEHRFIKEQTTRGSSSEMMRDGFQSPRHGSITPPALDLHPDRAGVFPIDMGFPVKPVSFMTSVASRSLRDNARTITSLPVSPSSSPLRQFGHSHWSTLPSPTHPTFSPIRQNGFTLDEYSQYSMRPQSPNTRYIYDPWQDLSPFRVQTPGGSPRTRVI